MNILRIDVPGVPVAQGSKRAFNNRVVDSNSSTLRPWRAAVTAAAAEQKRGTMVGAVNVQIGFRFPRPTSHYGTGRNDRKIRPSAPRDFTKKPDIDKLIRAILDALTDAGVWRDDSQVTSLSAVKEYAREGQTDPGVVIQVIGREEDTE